MTRAQRQIQPAAAVASVEITTALLGHYLAEWGASILKQARAAGRTDSPEAHLVYVNAFATRAYSPVRRGAGDEDFSVSLTGIRALDALVARADRLGISIRTNTVLLESDPANVERLLATLHAAGLGERAHRTRDLASLRAGDIALVPDDFRTAAPDLLRYAGGNSHVLYLIDPPAPERLPLGTLRDVARQRNTDVLARFPTGGFYKQAQFRGIPLADLPVYGRRIVDGYSALFGDPRHEWVRLWRNADAADGEDAAEALMVEHYRSRLTEALPGAVVRPLPLASSGEGTKMLHFFLINENPTRVLRMNAVLRAARVRGEMGWPESGSAVVREEDTGVLDLFFATSGATKDTSAAVSPRIRRVDLPALTHAIATRFAGRTISFPDVLMEFVETELFVDDVRRAMSLLRKAGRASYRSLAEGAEIVVAEAGRTVQRSPAPDRRKSSAAGGSSDQPVLPLP